MLVTNVILALIEKYKTFFIQSKFSSSYLEDQTGSHTAFNLQIGIFNEIRQL